MQDVANSGGKPAYLVKLKQGGKQLTSRSVNYGSTRTKEEALELAIAAGEKLQKEYPGATFDREPKVPNKSFKGRQPASKLEHRDDIVNRFGNLAQFKSMIRAAVKYHGAVKVRQCLDEAQVLVEEQYKIEKQKQEQMKSANMVVARAIWEQRQQGLDMPSPTPEIEMCIRQLEKKSRTAKESKREGFYMLDDVVWDGSGHPPVEFIKYQKNGGNLEDLRC